MSFTGDNPFQQVRKEQQSLQEDSATMRELELYITNNADIYRQRITSIIKNYKRKIAKGVFDEKLAVKGFVHAVTDGIKAYNKEFGSSIRLSGSDKQELANKLLDNYIEEIREDVECFCEACWKGYEKKGMKKMFGKMYPNCVKKTKKD